MKRDGSAVRWRSAVFAAALVGAGSVVGVAPTAAPVAATPFGAQVRSQQYNLCDAACNRPDPPANLVIWMTAAEAPHTVSLNELCRKSLEDIQNATGLGISFYQSRTSNNCPIASNGQRGFGNGTIVSGTMQDDDGGPFFEQWPGVVEIRGWVCRRGSTYIGWIVSCSAHMYNDDVGTAQTQASEYAYWVSLAPHSNHPMRVLGGDFNLSPTQRPAAFWGSSSVYSRPIINLTLPSEGPTRTVDYMHVFNPQYNYSEENGKNCAWSYSDHCYIWSAYR
jgi:hypothetical protein